MPRLDLSAIAASLEAVQLNFADINKDLSSSRDAMTDEVRDNMIAGYEFVDRALGNGTELFEPGNSADWLELNTLVLCGTSEERRTEAEQHIASNRDRFYDRDGGGIGSVMGYLEQHRKDSIWKRAAGVYIFMLSRPQLYIEGNHRTGALIMSYMLAREGKPPFVLSSGNAKAYFDPSSLVTTTRKGSIAMLIRLPKLKKRFAQLLKEEADPAYLLNEKSSKKSA